MDKKSIIGIVLIGILFFGFTIYSSRQQQKYQEELAKLRQAGLDHCVCGDEDAASARRIEAEKHPERYYMLPSFDCREKYMPTHGRGLDTKGQVTLLVTAEQLQLIDALFDRESGCVRGLYSESQGQTVKSYRYQIVGLLLHNPLLQELQKQ